MPDKRASKKSVANEMSERADDDHGDLLERLDRALAALQSIDQPECRGAMLLTLLEAEGVRVKVKNRKKHSKKADH
jgi:hypothetical protein